MIIFQDWKRKDSAFFLDEKKSKIVRHSTTRINRQGYCSKVGGEIAALYSNQGKVLFRFGIQEWNALSNEIHFFYRRFLTFEFFSVKVSGRFELKRKIHDYRLCDLFSDPTIDNIDQDNLFFLKWVYDRLHDKDWLLNLKQAEYI